MEEGRQRFACGVEMVATRLKHRVLKLKVIKLCVDISLVLVSSPLQPPSTRVPPCTPPPHSTHQGEGVGASRPRTSREGRSVSVSSSNPLERKRFAARSGLDSCAIWLSTGDIMLSATVEEATVVRVKRRLAAVSSLARPLFGSRVRPSRFAPCESINASERHSVPGRGCPPCPGRHGAHALRSRIEKGLAHRKVGAGAVVGLPLLVDPRAEHVEEGRFALVRRARDREHAERRRQRARARARRRRLRTRGEDSRRWAKGRVAGAAAGDRVPDLVRLGDAAVGGADATAPTRRRAPCGPARLGSAALGSFAAPPAPFGRWKLPLLLVLKRALPDNHLARACTGCAEIDFAMMAECPLRAACARRSPDKLKGQPARGGSIDPFC